MKYIIIVVAFLNYFSVYSQKKFKGNIIKIDSTQLHFEDLKINSDLYDFRFWNQGQVIEIRILSDSTKIGTITNFVTGLNYKRKVNATTSIPQSYVQKIKLSDYQFEEVFKSIKLFKITNLDSDDKILNWKSPKELFNEKEYQEFIWFDVEEKVNGVYTKKKYSNPEYQIELDEAKSFVEFYSNLKMKLQLMSVYCNFFTNLPLDWYLINGKMIHTDANYYQRYAKDKKRKIKCN